MSTRRIPDALRALLAPVARGGRSRARTLAVVLAPAVIVLVLAGALAPALSGSTGRIPVAVVNLDDGTRGDDLVDSLLESGELAWTVADESEAERGLADGTYELVLKIPEDYSACVASLDGADPVRAAVEIVSDGGVNALATEAGSEALKQVQARLRADLGEEYLLSVLGDMRGTGSRLTLTADGTAMLDAGYDALAQGADAVSAGLGQTATGTAALASGIDGIASGVGGLGTGAAALAEGLSAVSGQAVGPPRGRTRSRRASTARPPPSTAWARR